MPPALQRPAELVLTAAVARRHYLAGRSKVEISEEFGISRFQVARLLEKARASGLVRIEIGRPGPLDLDSSCRLQDAFGLQHVVVVDTGAEDGATLRAHLGSAAAGLLTEITTARDVLGLAWARAVSAMLADVATLPRVPVVQLTGSLSGHGVDDSAVEVVRGLAALAGGPAYVFYSPMIVADAVTAQALRAQPEVARAFAAFESVTKAVVGIGGWSPGDSMVYDVATPKDRALLQGLGVCAEFSGVFVTANGEPVESELTDRLVAVTVEQMRTVPEVLAIAYGLAKAPAVRAALRSGLVTSLITHKALALSLLEEQ